MNQPHQQAALAEMSTLLENGDAEAAEALAMRALTQWPDHPDFTRNLASALAQMGRIDEAEKLYRLALALDPAQPRAALGLGHVLRMRGRPREAKLIFRDAVALTPNSAEAHYGLALALQESGELSAAEQAYRDALRLDPANLDAHQEMNQLLWRLKRDGEFLRSYDEAEAMMPALPHFALHKAGFLMRSDAYAPALALFERALRLEPGNPSALQGQAAALLQLGQIEAAIDRFEDVLKRNPADGNALTSVGAAYLIHGEAARAEAAALRALVATPGDQIALAVLGTAWRLLDDAREHDLNRYDDFIQAIDLEPPQGHVDMESFHQELAAYLDKMHFDAREPIDQSARGGTQTVGNIFNSGHVLIDRLQVRIQEAVARYIGALPKDKRHPFLSQKKDKFRFSGAWSSRLKNNGFHTNHLHPAGWISSAYYVSVPDCVADTGRQEGWIKFGEPSYDVGLAQPIRRAIQPKPGRLVLFPSYMWHGTVPFQAPQNRTTIAFDVVPDK